MTYPYTRCQWTVVWVFMRKTWFACHYSVKIIGDGWDLTWNLLSSGLILLAATPPGGL
jgi:hypothetical protein